MKAQSDSIRTLTVRFDLANDRDRAVWEYLHTDGRKKHRSSNNAVIEDLTEYIRTTNTVQTITDALSAGLTKAIRQEFSRIISPVEVRNSIPEPEVKKETDPDDALRKLLNSPIFDG